MVSLGSFVFNGLTFADNNLSTILSWWSSFPFSSYAVIARRNGFNWLPVCVYHIYGNVGKTWLSGYFREWIAEETCGTGKINPVIFINDAKWEVSTPGPLIPP